MDLPRLLNTHTHTHTYRNLISFLNPTLSPQTAGWKGVLGRVEMRTDINQRYSATLYRVTLHNPHPKPDHLHLAMLLPADAYVSSLTMYVLECRRVC